MAVIASNKRRVWSIEARRKLSEANSGERNHNFGKYHSLEIRNKMGRKGEKNPNWGKHYSAEHRRKIGRNGKDNPMFGKHLFAKEKNPCWKGGVTPLTQQIRKCFKNRQWRSDVFTRDDFTCVLCGERGGYINADHYPKSFSDIFYENKIKTLQEAENCEEFWNINNGRTLCFKCHNNTKKGRRKR